jgi:hypothetical protein
VPQVRPDLQPPAASVQQVPRVPPLQEREREREQEQEQEQELRARPVLRDADQSCPMTK